MKSCINCKYAEETIFDDVKKCINPESEYYQKMIVFTAAYMAIGNRGTKNVKYKSKMCKRIQSRQRSYSREYIRDNRRTYYICQRKEVSLKI